MIQVKQFFRNIFNKKQTTDWLNIFSIRSTSISLLDTKNLFIIKKNQKIKEFKKLKLEAIAIQNYHNLKVLIKNRYWCLANLDLERRQQFFQETIVIPSIGEKVWLHTGMANSINGHWKNHELNNDIIEELNKLQNLQELVVEDSTLGGFFVKIKEVQFFLVCWSFS